MALSEFCRVGNCLLVESQSTDPSRRGEILKRFTERLKTLLESESQYAPNPRVEYENKISHIFSGTDVEWLGVQSYLDSLNALELKELKEALKAHGPKVHMTPAHRWEISAIPADAALTYIPVDYFDGIVHNKAHYAVNPLNNSLTLYLNHNGQLREYVLPRETQKVLNVIAAEGDAVYVVTAAENAGRDFDAKLPEGPYQALLKIEPGRQSRRVAYEIAAKKFDVHPVDGATFLLRSQSFFDSQQFEFIFLDPLASTFQTLKLPNDTVPLAATAIPSHLKNTSESEAPIWVSKSERKFFYFKLGKLVYLESLDPQFMDRAVSWKYLDESKLMLSYGTQTVEGLVVNDRAVLVDMQSGRLHELNQEALNEATSKGAFSYVKEMELISEDEVMLLVGEDFEGQEHKRVAVWNFISGIYRDVSSANQIDFPRKDGKRVVQTRMPGSFFVLDPKAPQDLKHIELPPRLFPLIDEQHESSGDFYQDAKGNVFRLNVKTKKVEKIIEAPLNAVALTWLTKDTALFAGVLRGKQERHVLYLYRKGQKAAVEIDVLLGSIHSQLKFKNIKALGRPDLLTVTLEEIYTMPGESNKVLSEKLLLLDLSTQNVHLIGQWDKPPANIVVEHFGADGMIYVHTDDKLRFYRLEGDAYVRFQPHYELEERGVVFVKPYTDDTLEPMLYMMTTRGPRIFKQSGQLYYLTETQEQH